MNWQHLRAFLWLRWRLLVNQWRRGGAINAILMLVVAWCALVLATPLFIGSFVLGLFALPRAEPVHLLYAWDGLLLAFFFFWCLGLMTDLQRTETLSLSKFMHLPVSIKGAFLINYLSSLLGLSLLIFVPVMFGFALGLIFAKGILLLCVLPLLAAFLLMVTALTYQFQGWLASLMSNPRRRKTVVVVATMLFVVLFQLPSLLNVAAPWRARAEQSNALVTELEELNRAFQAREFDAQEHLRRQEAAIKKHQLATEQAQRAGAEQLEQTARFINLVVPLGWLPLGVMRAAEGNIVPALLGCLGMALVGAASLWRAYRTTVRLYQGDFTAHKRRWPGLGWLRKPRSISKKAADADRVGVPSPASAAGARRHLLEARLPGLSEPVSVIALGGFRCLVRAPEAKMMLLTPLLLAVFFGFGALQRAGETPVMARPLLAVAAMALVHFGLMQLMFNQFGFERDGFRVFVLSAVARRDILLGKNLAFLPLALAMAAVMLAIVQVVYPMRLDHLLALLPQFISMFLLFCLLANLLSIYAPMPIAAGSLKPVSPKLIPVLVQMAMFLCLFPLTQAPALLPLAIEWGLESLGWTAGMPICLLLSVLQCAAVMIVYHFVMIWQGGLFHAREQRILEAVTGRTS